MEKDFRRGPAFLCLLLRPLSEAEEACFHIQKNGNEANVGATFRRGKISFFVVLEKTIHLGFDFQTFLSCFVNRCIATQANQTKSRLTVFI